MNEHILFFQVALLLLLIALSAFFSGSETALFSLSRARLLAYKNETKLSLRLIVDLMENYHATLIVLILGNMFVNTGIAMTGDLVLSNLGLPPLLTTILSIFMAIFLLLIFGEVTPKALALKNAETVSSMVAIPIYFLRCLLTPFI